MSLRDLLAAARDRLDQGEADDAPEAVQAPAGPPRPNYPPPQLTPAGKPFPTHGQHYGSRRLDDVDITAPAPAAEAGPGAEPAAVDWWSARTHHPDSTAVPEHVKAAFRAADRAAAERAATEPVSKDNDADEADEDGGDEAGEDEAGEGDEQGSGGVRARLAGWTTGGKGRAPIPRPANAAPARPEGTGYRTSFAEWRAGIDPRWKALAQNGAGLGVGWYLGIPQWIARETAYLVEHCDGFTDSMALTGYVPAAVIIWADRRTHRARGFLAYPARALTVCLIVGVFCQGIAQHL